MSEAPNTDAAAATGQQPAPDADAAATNETETVDYWKQRSRQNEQRAKDNSKAADQLAKLEAANLSETERLAKDKTASDESAAKWRGKFNELNKSKALAAAATDAKAADPETVALWLDRAVTLDDEGNPQGIDAALKALQAAKPHLFRTAPEGARDIFGQQQTPPGLNEDALTAALRTAVGI